MTAADSELRVDVCEENLCGVEADCAVLAVFDDQRPLRGGVGLVDWRLCGRLSQLLKRDLFGPRWVLLPSEGRLRVPRILVGGIGTTQGLDSAKLRDFAREAAGRALELGARSLAWDLALAGPAVTAESAAASVLGGFSAALKASRMALELRLCVPPEEGLRWRVAVERAVARQPRGEAPLRLAPSGDARAGANSPAATQVARRAP